ncbi:hypothetical protein GGTG_01724 [Gaeumannomyces tritici R3-111a-1]|uniref:Secreted protein n=1 Tax=Gaeumannomyces tritici (strain R3-111a-1) TaxID=644352 RepID=J3NKE5_GAET3|nr:hypothetical protein GGTG_01724 [Gaeumannomyces tritici R3-111a-1]EJT81749.1 hypothetical protein GGTG_01724 [Gaeumannomyces tritici R3-111a-1]
MSRSLGFIFWFYFLFCRGSPLARTCGVLGVSSKSSRRLRGQGEGGGAKQRKWADEVGVRGKGDDDGWLRASQQGLRHRLREIQLGPSLPRHRRIGHQGPTAYDDYDSGNGSDKWQRQPPGAPNLPSQSASPRAHLGLAIAGFSHWDKKRHKRQ